MDTAPKSEIIEYEGVTYLSYSIEIDPSAIQNSIMTLLDQCFEQWMQQSFSGNVWLKASSQALTSANQDLIKSELDRTVSQAQAVVNENNFTTADGKPIFLMYSLQ